MTDIILEKKFDKKGKYLGKIVVYEDDLTPEFIEAIKLDVNDKKGWKKHHQKLREKGYDI